MLKRQLLSAVDVVDLDKEFSLLVALVQSLWDGFDRGDVVGALRQSFESGLKDARLWVDEYTTMRIAQALNENNEICLPLHERQSSEVDGDYAAYLYDALCRFDSNLSDGLRNIYGSVTRYGRWNYCTKADALCQKLKTEFGLLEVAPKDQDSDTQKAIANGYSGLHAGEAGTLSTPEKLLRKYVVYSRDEQGLSFFRSVFSAVYSHGLYCAKIKNTQMLVNDLLPIYSKRDEPINFDNGEEILAIALKNPFVDIIHRMNPFAFSSTEKYAEAKENARMVQAERTSETPEQKALREKDFIRSLLSNIDIDDDRARVDSFLDSILPSAKAFKLT